MASYRESMLDILTGMPHGRPRIPAKLERDLKLEVGFRCPIPGCRESVLQRAHLIDYAKTRDDSFGNQIMLCPTCHAKHTNHIIKTKDLRVLKAQLAWENGRYTEVEETYLSLFAQYHGTYFAHLKKGECCLRFLVNDGYIEHARDDLIKGEPMAVYHLTRNGRYFSEAWIESRARQPRFNAPDARRRRAC